MNVVFYDTTNQARLDGFRPCHRCKPDDATFIGQREEVVLRTLALLRIKKDNATMKYGLKELAKEVGVTPSYLCRVFKRTMGVTVGEYIKQFEIDVSKGQTESSTQCSDSAELGEMDIGMGPVATPWSLSDTESLVQSPSRLGSSMADIDAGFSMPVTISNSPLAPIESWPASVDVPPFHTSTGTDEALDMYFDFDEWLWTEGFDFNDWFSTSDLSNDGVYG
jgi:AraC-like DNA-binding protein